MKNNFTLNIGIEVHCVLMTKTKLCSPAKNNFGDAPNSNINSIDLALPGTTPVINKKAVELAIKAGLSLNCEIASSLRFDRKNYFYPDLPKGFQITQFHNPIAKNGYVELSNGKKIIIEKVILEEDTAKQFHKNGYSYLDYNRAGVPLIEIVTDANIQSAEEAVEYVSKLRNIVIDQGISEGKFEEGKFRCDVNISIKPTSSSIMGTRVEVKNLNTLKNITNAINHEFESQKNILTNGGKISQVTKRFDETNKETITMRSKSSEIDYNFFHEPSILPTIIQKEWIDKISSSLVKSKEDLADEWIQKYSIKKDIIYRIINDSILLVYFKFFIDELGNNNYVNIYDNNKKDKFLITKLINDRYKRKEKLSDEEVNIFSNFLAMDFKNIIKYGEPEQYYYMSNFESFFDCIENIIYEIHKGTIQKRILKKFLKEIICTSNNSELKQEIRIKGIKSWIISHSFSNFDEKNFVKSIFASNANLKQDIITKPDKTENYIVGQAMKNSKGKANPIKIREEIKKYK